IRDVAPRPDDLQRLTVHTSDQTLSIVHPAIGAIAAAEAVLDRLNSVVKEFSDCLLDAGEIVGMNAITPKVRVLQVLRRRVAKHRANIVTDVGRSKIATGFEAVDHRRGRTQQPHQTFLRGRLHLTQPTAAPAFALAGRMPYGLFDNGSRAIGIEIARRDMQDVV